MGFSASFSYYLPLKKGVKIEEVEKEFNKNSNLGQYFGDNIEFNKEIIFCDTGGNYNEGEYYQLFNFMAKFVNKKAYFDFSGDEDSYWRINFDGKGKWVEENGTIMYAFNAYDEFMTEYSEYMDKGLKKQLKKFIKDVKVVKKI